MNEQIQDILDRIERREGVTILFACESGSRSWGIASPDSDWDLRFIYARPIEGYLTLWPGADTIQRLEKHEDAEIDAAGWDVRKALYLASKSNPSLLEWLASEIVYREHRSFVEPLRDAMAAFSPRALMHHYVGMAERQYGTYWRNDNPVPFKKYLYAVRPLLCVLWMRANDYAMPPMDFEELLAGTPLDKRYRGEMQHLLELKRQSSETGGAGRLPRLDSFIVKMIGSGHDLANEAPPREPDFRRLDQLFRETVMGTAELEAECSCA